MIKIEERELIVALSKDASLSFGRPLLESQAKKDMIEYISDTIQKEISNLVEFRLADNGDSWLMIVNLPTLVILTEKEYEELVESEEPELISVLDQNIDIIKCIKTERRDDD